MKVNISESIDYFTINLQKRCHRLYKIFLSHEPYHSWTLQHIFHCYSTAIIRNLIFHHFRTSHHKKSSILHVHTHQKIENHKAFQLFLVFNWLRSLFHANCHSAIDLNKLLAHQNNIMYHGHPSYYCTNTLSIFHLNCINMFHIHFLSHFLRLLHTNPLQIVILISLRFFNRFELILPQWVILMN